MNQKRTIWLLVLLALVGLTASLLTGCGGQQAATESPDGQQEAVEQQAAPEEPSEQQAPAEQETISEDDENQTTSIDGKTLLEERCAGCHSLEKAQSGQRDLAGWQAIVDEMIEKGAKLNQDEAKVLAEYLANLD